MADRPRFKKVFDSAIFRDIGSNDEVLEVNWTNPNGQPGTKSFSVGTEIFPDGALTLSQVPDEQLIASMSMAAILSSSLPGTQEYLVNMGADQENDNFQSIAGPFKLDTVTPVDNPSLGGEGEVFSMNIKKTSGNQSKAFDADVYTLSDYDTIKDNYDHVALVLPAALHAEFGFQKADLGTSGSPNRTSVINFVLTKKFWS